MPQDPKTLAPQDVRDRFGPFLEASTTFPNARRSHADDSDQQSNLVERARTLNDRGEIGDTHAVQTRAVLVLHRLMGREVRWDGPITFCQVLLTQPIPHDPVCVLQQPDLRLDVVERFTDNGEVPAAKTIDRLC